MKFPLISGPKQPRTALATAVPGLLLLACVGLGFGGEPLRELARYERVGLAAGEWWRLVSGHLVHLGPGHLLMNVVALTLVIVLLHGLLSAWEWLGSVVLAMLAIDLGLFWGSPEVAWYVGLSGVLHGLLVAGALRLLVLRSWLGVVLVLGVGLKLAWEQRFGTVPVAMLSGGPVVVDAHLYGALGGVVWTLLAFGVRRAQPARL